MSLKEKAVEKGVMEGGKEALKWNVRLGDPLLTSSFSWTIQFASIFEQEWKDAKRSVRSEQRDSGGSASATRRIDASTRLQRHLEAPNLACSSSPLQVIYVSPLNDDLETLKASPRNGFRYAHKFWPQKPYRNG